jgi:hypothetical protein
MSWLRSAGTDRYRGAVCVSVNQAAPDSVQSRATDTEGLPTSNHVYNAPENENIIDLYSVGHEMIVGMAGGRNGDVPFVHGVELKGAQGEIVRVRALFDGGAQVGAMCSSIFRKVQHRLGEW